MTLKDKQNLLSQLTAFINNLSVEDVAEAPAEPKAVEKIELLTIKECAQLIDGLTEGTVRQLVTQNKIPSIRSGAGKRGKILVSKAALLKYFGG